MCHKYLMQHVFVMFYCSVWYCNFPLILMKTSTIGHTNDSSFYDLSKHYLLSLLFCLSPLCLSMFLSVSALQLTLNPVQQQQLMFQQAQAQILAAAVQYSASQQNSTTGASISASAATPITQLPLSQPIQIAPVRHSHPYTSVYLFDSFQL